MDMVGQQQPHTVVIDLSAVMMLDLDGDNTLAKLSGELHRKNIQVLLVRVGSDNLELMRKTGTLEIVGSQNIYKTMHAAVAAAEKAGGELQQA